MGVLRSFVRPTPQPLFVMPWLVTPFLRSVFSVEPLHLQAPTVAEPPAMLMVPTPVVREAPPIAGLPLCGGGARKRRKLEPWSNAVEESRAAVLIVWRRLVETTPEASSLGRWIAAEPNVDAKMTIIADTLADKATATIRLRGRDFGRFVMWVDAEKVDLTNICESTAYSYCMSLRASGASLTSFDRFRKALAWAAHVVGWHVEPAALSSRRVEGAAVVALRNMPKVKRAPPVPPGFMKHLELRAADVSLGVELRYR
eukprot:3327378-Amphidinium_carterae.1